MHAAGSVPLSMIYLGSKLVFHDVDKLTSFYMHYTYMLAFYVIRYWNRDPNSGFAMPSEWEAALDNWGFVDYLKHVFQAAITYGMWSAYYYVKIFVINWEKIQKRKYDTLYHYTVSGGGNFAEFINSKGVENNKIM